MWRCIPLMQGWNLKEHHSSLLQPKITNDSTNWCFEERTRSCVTTKFHSSNVCFQSIDWSWEELPELGVRVSSYNLGNGEVSLLSLWQAVYLGDRPETIGGNLQEAHGGDLSQDTTTSSPKFPVPALWCAVSKRSGDTISRCSEQGDPSTHGRRWNPATDNCGQSNYGKHSMQFQWFGPDPWGN